jgi:hypothetical protein
MFPTQGAIGKVFSAHYAYWTNFAGIASDSAANGEVAVSRQYAGRVPFELLQNALDRATARIVVRSDGERLVVANDGQPVSCDPAFEYTRSIGDSNRPSDFQSLCSMHTSNKNPDDDNGNKGVGFRSVFSIAPRVEVWSRLDGGGWWGLLLVRDLTLEVWQAAANHPAVVAGRAAFLADQHDPTMAMDERRPSYHFPLPLHSAVAPVDGLDWAHTIIVLPCENDEAKRSVAASMASLKRSHLEFVGLRGRPPVTVEVDDDLTLTTAVSEQVVARWDVVAVPGEAPHALFGAAHKAGLAVHKHIGGAVRWPHAEQDVAGKIYCHLATEVSCPFSIDLHADLQTGIDRKHLDLQANEPVGAYNSQLLLRSLDLHVAEIRVHAADREDLWRFLDPGTDLKNLRPEVDPVRHLLAWGLGKQLFPQSGGAPANTKHAWAEWAQLAARCFDGRPRPVRTFRQFWAATEHWINAVYPSSQKEAQKLGVACLEALHAAGARVIPITATADLSDGHRVEDAAAPPAPWESGRPGEKLFHVTEAQRDYLAAIDVPPAIRRRGRRVTAWPVTEPFRKDGRLVASVHFDRAALLQELRQLSGRSEPSAVDDRSADDAQVQQIELIRFAASLFQLQVREGQALRSYAEETWSTLPGWRADHDDKMAVLFHAGRAVATLFLPMRDGRWAPARQLAGSEVADWLADSLRDTLSDDVIYLSFLGFLGVAVWQGELALVEGGSDGVVQPVARPPMLVDAATGLAIPPLAVPASQFQPNDLRHRLELAWATWLPELERRELARPNRIRVCAGLGGHAFVPVGKGPGCGAAPASAAGVAEFVAPRRLTLLTRQPQRVDEVLWRVRVEDDGMLRALGARRLEERLHDPTLAVGLLCDMKLAYPDPGATVEASPPLRYVLVELFNRALEAIAKADSSQWPVGLPLLAEVPVAGNARASTLRWVDAAEVFVATDNPSRAVVRRLARDVPLLVTTIGPNQAKGTPVAARVLHTKVEVVADDEVVDAGVGSIHEELASLLPRLLALAEVSRRFNRVVDPANAADRWRTMRLYRSSDVWRRWTFSGPDFKREEPDRKGKWDDVMHIDERSSADPVGPSRIFYDVPPGRSGAPCRPPWTHFAESLAEILLDRSIESDWRAALGEYDAGGMGRLDDYLERVGVTDDLVAAMLAGLAPLAADLLADHRARVAVALARFGLQLAEPAWTANASLTLFLGPNLKKIEGAVADVTQEVVNQALAAADFPGDQARFVPHVIVSSANLAAWERYQREHDLGVRLLRYKFDQRHPQQPRPRDDELRCGELARDLAGFIAGRVGQLTFAPEAAALMWLEVPPRAEPLSVWLPLLTTFQSVAAAPSVPSWAPLPARETRPSTSTAPPPTPEEVEATDAAKVAKGDGAEVALLAWVAPRTQSLLASSGPTARILLLSAFPAVGVARERIERALSANDEALLRDALWVSRCWRGSGFDIVGLDVDCGQLVVRRYEVKALPEQPNVRLFISANELAVYRATRVPGTASRPDLRVGSWDLVGVRPRGPAVVLTDALQPVVDPLEGGLGSLRIAGFRPDDLQLVIRIHGGDGSKVEEPEGIA